LQAASYFELGEFAAAENIFSRILKRPKLKPAQKKEYSDKLALAIYRQGEQSREQQDISRAIHHFARVVELAPRSNVAATGLYDAIALNIQHKQWQSAIGQIRTFQQRFPRHRLQADVSKKLSLAYLKSDQGIKAAQEFEKISKLDSDREVRAAALWQAAELYEKKNKPNEAIKTYKKYIDNFQKPYTQRLEGMYKIAQLYLGQGNTKLNLRWLNTAARVDRKTLGNQKTVRSRRINAEVNLALARYEMARFGRIRLVAPLKTNLENKRKAMQGATHFFAKASVDKIYEIATESTYSIGRIYKDFSKALLESERPKNLNDEELEQYEILLEDQAFPFEDKAIEFLEINLARIKDGHYNDWIRKSHDELKTLFPVRYAREPKLDDYIEEIN
jgi:tetratricopeptide (TPR) repeat protein